MRKIKIGKSGIEASVLALGTWAIGGGSWWGDNDDRESAYTIRQAVELGINLIDTAPVYGFGHSEIIVGKAIKGIRDKVILSTKCGLRWSDNEGSLFFSLDGKTVRRNVSAKAIRADVEDSLLRMDIDYIDILFTHWQAVESSLTPIEETMDAMLRLKKEGKIRAIGASNLTPFQFEQYLASGPLDIIQEKYSILDRRAESELAPLCREHGVVFQAYSPLEQGILTGKIDKEYRPEEGSARSGQKWFAPENLARAVDLVNSWDDLCKKYGCSPANLAVAWLLAQGDNVDVLCGARKREQLGDNINSVNIVLEKADVERMRKDAEAI